MNGGVEAKGREQGPDKAGVHGREVKLSGLVFEGGDCFVVNESVAILGEGLGDLSKGLERGLRHREQVGRHLSTFQQAKQVWGDV